MIAPDQAAARRRVGGARPWEWTLACLAALVLIDAFDTAFAAGFGAWAALAPGLPVARLPLLVVAGATALLLAADWRGAAANARAAWPLWPAVGLALASAAWSDAPGTTLLWSVALILTSGFGVALATRFSPRQQVELVAALAASIALVSLAAGLLGFDFALSHRGWRGIYSDKNLLGRVMALGAAAAAVCALDRRRRGAALVGLGLCVGLAAASTSRTALLTCACAVATVVLLAAVRRWPRRAAPMLAAGASAAGIALALLLFTHAGLALLGRTQEFSNRSRIWQKIIGASREHVWLGAGYGAFWPGSGGRAAQTLPRLGAIYGNAHNGAVDLYADLGAVGLVLVFVALAWVAWHALRYAIENPSVAAVWPAAYLVFFVASNAAESAFVRHKLYWALYVAAACQVSSRRV